MTLPAFAVERRAVAPLPLSAPAAGTRRRRPQQGVQHQTRRPPLLLLLQSIDETSTRP